jgi:transitional endoplasmic reticulum ATPase
VNGPEIIDKWYGSSEARLREIFAEGAKHAPAIIFMDEIDAIAPKREEMSGDRQVERRVVAQLLATLDGLESRGQVIVLAATNIPDTLDPALRRPGRFDREIAIGAPDESGRREIIEIHSRGMPLAEDVDLDRLAANTHGFVGADLAAVCREAAMSAMRGILREVDLSLPQIPFEKLLALRVTQADFEAALSEVEPSAIREVVTQRPQVGWEDVGGLHEVRRLLDEAVIWPLVRPELFERIGISPCKGVLLYGPPGTGKTLVAKAVAREADANFVSIRGPQLLSRWVGESEKGVREIFKKARQVAPCLVFFDELESLAPVRGKGDSQVLERVVSQLLAEMDGLEELRGVVVLAATNRLDLVDPALLRPGRFDVLVEMESPNSEGRREIWEVVTRRMPLAADVDLGELAERTQGLTGADIEGICRRAGMHALREFTRDDGLIPDSLRVGRRHFERSLSGLTAYRPA